MHTGVSRVSFFLRIGCCLTSIQFNIIREMIFVKLTARIGLCNDSLTFEKGTPFERRGRKASGLRDYLRQRGCQISKVSSFECSRPFISWRSPGNLYCISPTTAVIAARVRTQTSNLVPFDFGVSHVSQCSKLAPIRPVSFT